MKKITEHLKLCFSLKSSIICVLALIVSVAASVLAVEGLKYEVKINDNGNIISTYVYSKTVEDALSEAGIKVNEYDKLSLDRKADLKSVKSLDILRAKSVNIVSDGKEETVYTTLNKVGELLDERKVAVNDDSLLITPREIEITDGLKIEIIKKVYEEISETEVVPFTTEKKANYNMDKGNTRVARNGADGEKQVTYRVLKHNGEIIEKEKISEKVTKNPISKLIEYGTVTASVSSRGDSLRYKKVIDCKATAYCLKGRTASGRYTERGVVAVDPRVIPLGSRLYIETPDGRFVYGHAVAADTGGSIKGNKVDLYMETRSECLNFGVRNVKVYVLE